MSAAQLTQVVISLLAFGGPRHVLPGELSDKWFVEALDRALARMSQYYLRQTSDLLLEVGWDREHWRLKRQNPGSRADATSSLDRLRYTPGIKGFGSVTETLRRVLGTENLAQIPDLLGKDHTEAEQVLANLLMVILEEDKPSRDLPFAYRQWNWLMIGAEIGDALSALKEADWLRVTRTTEAAALVVRRYCSGECDERTWSPGAPYSLKSVQTWMEREKVGEFIAGRMSNGQVALVFATGKESAQRWHFMTPSDWPKMNNGLPSLRELVSCASPSVCKDWPENSSIRTWLVEVGRKFVRV